MSFSIPHQPLLVAPSSCLCLPPRRRSPRPLPTTPFSRCPARCALLLTSSEVLTASSGGRSHPQVPCCRWRVPPATSTELGGRLPPLGAACEIRRLTVAGEAAGRGSGCRRVDSSSFRVWLKLGGVVTGWSLRGEGLPTGELALGGAELRDGAQIR